MNRGGRSELGRRTFGGSSSRPCVRHIGSFAPMAGERIQHGITLSGLKVVMVAGLDRRW